MMMLDLRFILGVMDFRFVLLLTRLSKCILEQDNLSPWIDYGLALKDLVIEGNGDINSLYGLGNVDVTKEVIHNAGFVSESPLL